MSHLTAVKGGIDFFVWIFFLFVCLFKYLYYYNYMGYLILNLKKKFEFYKIFSRKTKTNLLCNIYVFLKLILRFLKKKVVRKKKLKKMTKTKKNWNFFKYKKNY